jgi:large subunit ribosomal protein L17
MLRNLASGLILTERDAELDENAPAVKGRVVTTLHKAKEVRPLVEKCVTIARRSLKHSDAANEFSIDAERNSDEWKQWRKSDKWQQWNQAIAPVVAARRRVLQLLGDKEAMSILFDEIAPRFADRDGGYTRILRLAKPRLGDGGIRAALEFVGVRDRVTVESEQPSFADDAGDNESTSEAETPSDESVEETTDAEASTDAGENESAGEEKKEE